MAAADFAGTSRYQVVRQLAVGGMGVIFEVEDRQRGQRVALKTLRRADADLLYRLKREFRALAGLAHPNLVALHDLVVDGEHCFFTMELVDGVDFLRHVEVAGDAADRSGMRCHEGRLRAALAQLAAAVAALHRAGKVHRDIKPANIVVDAAGRLVLLDLGLVVDHAPDTMTSSTGRLLGTAAYMAPEQALSESQLGPAVDWYAVGVIVYEALTGRLPFRGTFPRILMAKQQEEPPPLRGLAPGVPDDLEALCRDLLRRLPEERPGDDEVLRRLGGAPDAGAPVAPPTASLVGRDRELEQLLQVVDSGRPAALLVAGPSGIGKSALVRAFLDQLRRRRPGAVALQGRCYERENVPYRAMDPLVDHLSRYWERLPLEQAALLAPRDAALLGQLFPVLGRIKVVAEAPQRRSADPQQQRTLAYAALREVLARLAERLPLVLALDDLQWVDSDTLVLLADVMRPPDPPPLTLLLVTRPGGAPALERLLGELELATDRIDVEPLSRDDARALARSLVAGRADLSDGVVDEAEGNPFLIGQLAMAVEAGGTADVDLEQALAGRVARLPGEARRVLEVVAVAGEPLRRRIVAAAAGLDAAGLDEATHLLRAGSFVHGDGRDPDDPLETYHDRIREAVVAALPAEVLAATHRELAEAMAGDSDERLARHWEGAGDRVRAAGHAARAAATAMARLDFDRAAGLYRRALALGDHGADQERGLQVDLGEALAQAGRAGEAADVFVAAAAAADPGLALDLQRRAAEQLLRGGDVDRGLEAIAAVLAAIGLGVPRGPRRSLIAFLLRRAQLRLRGRRWRRRAADQLPVEALTRVDAYAALGKTLPIVDPVRGSHALTRALLAALRLGEPARVARMLSFEVGYLAAFGEEKLGMRLAALAEEEAQRCGDPEALALAPSGLALVHYLAASRWREALRCQTEAGQRNKELQAAGWETDTSQLFACFSLMYLGELGELARRVSAHLAEARRRGDRYHQVSLRTRLGLVWLAADDPERAEREAVDAIASWIPAERAYQVQHFYALHGVCEARLYRGDGAGAAAALAAQHRPLRGSMLLRLPMLRAETAYLAGRIALACGDPAGARRQARRLGRGALPIAAALAMLLRAGADLLDQRTQRGIDGLRRAIDALEGLETMLHAHAARRRLGEIVGGADGAREIAAADAWMAGQGVLAPGRMARLFVPGPSPLPSPPGASSI